MKFGRLPLDQLDGAILAHGLTLAGRRLKKGHVLTSAEVAALATEGHETVLAARLESGDVPENEAAHAVARAIAGSGTKAQAPFTGRSNIYAEHAGIAEISSALIGEVNGVDEAVTVATLNPFEAVETGQMLATIKIIPFSVPEEILAQAVAKATPAIKVHAFGAKRVAVISTRLPETKDSVIAKGVELMRRRLERVGSSVASDRIVDHHENAVEAALTAAAPDSDLIVLFSASAITDRRDVVPAGLIAAGGSVSHYGMPVDPGNLMLLGELDGVSVVGAPGCARSPKENGFDWILQRLCAELPVGPREVQAMGVGGLLVDTAQRGAPREDRSPGAQRMPKVAAILLAAGQSRRMGPTNKLLADVDGQPMVRHALAAIRQSVASPVIAVTGHEAARVRETLGDADISFTHNALYAEGLSTSLGAGLLAVPAECDAAIVCLGDMPRVTHEIIDQLISAYNPVEGRAICVPTHRGKRGNPVLFDRRFFSGVLGLGGDVGARHLIAQHEDLVVEVEIDSDAIFMDVDTPEALERLT